MRLRALVGLGVVLSVVLSLVAAPAFASPPPTVTINSLTRVPSTDAASYDVTVVATDYRATKGACPYTANTCSLRLQALFANGQTDVLDSVVIPATSSAPYSHDFIGVKSEPQIVAFRWYVTSTTYQYGTWVPASDPYPTPTTSLSVGSITRDPGSGDLDYSVTATAKDFGLLDGPCSASGAYCDLRVVGELDSGPLIVLGNVVFSDGASSPQSDTFSSSISTSHVVAVAAYVSGNGGTRYSPWTPISDPLAGPVVNTAVGLSSVVLSRAPGTGYLDYDVDAISSGVFASGGVCNTSPTNCRIGLESMTTDGLIQNFGSNTYYIDVATPGFDFTGYQQVAQVAYLRGYAEGSGGLNYGPWVPVTDNLAAPTVHATINSIGRDSSTGYFNLDATATASHFLAPNGVCYPSSSCTLGIEVETADGGIASLWTNQYATATATSIGAAVSFQLGRVVAVRAYVYGSDGSLYGSWQPVHDPWGHESTGGSNPSETACVMSRVIVDR